MLIMQGYTVAIYIDNIIAIDQSLEEWYCGRNNKFVSKTGICNNPDKSKFVLVKIVEYLGFIIDSEKLITYILD